MDSEDLDALDEHEIHIAELSNDSDTSALDLEWFLDMGT